MYTPILEVTAGGGGARAPVPPPLNPPLGVWVLCYRTKRDACSIVCPGHCLFVYNTAAPPRRQSLH